MRERDVPQQNAKAFLGHSKLLYAETDDGHVVPASCSGWEAEEIVLDQAIAEYQRQATEAWERVRAGTASPLEYHMYLERMDPPLLAQSTGYSRWRVRRDLKPKAFARLPSSRLERYAGALGKSMAELSHLPDAP